MDDLDFSGLTDDQLLGLVRAALQEAVRRHPAMAEAARAAVLDEAEAARVAREAADKEARAQRARAREQVAAEAAARVRAEAAERNASAEAARLKAIAEAEAAERAAKQRAAREVAEAKAKAEIEAAGKREEAHRALLLKASSLVDLPPGNLTLVVYEGQVFINEGADRYSRDHLVEYRGLALSTRRHLIGRKPALLEFCATLKAHYTDWAIFGKNYFPRITQAEGATP